MREEAEREGGERGKEPERSRVIRVREEAEREGGERGKEPERTG